MVNTNQESSSDQPSLDELIALKEAAQRCELSYSHLRYLARESLIWATKLGYYWVTTQKAVDEYLARDRRPGPKPEPGASSQDLKQL